MKKQVRQIENLILLGTAGMSLIISLLDLSGLMDSSSAVAQRLPSLTLLCVGFIASYLVLERRGKIDEIAKSIRENKEDILWEIANSKTDIIKSIGSVEVRAFHNRGDFARFFSERISRAKRIDDLVWNNVAAEAMSRKDIDTVAKYSSTVAEVLRKPETIWREVVVFTKKRFRRTEERVLDQEIRGFNTGYIDAPQANEVPRMSFIIIDNEELLLAHLPGAENLRLSIKHPEIVGYFSKYYEALWKASTKIKQGEAIDYQQLDEQRERWTADS